tara:strand:- start:8996 stop:9601 length:606 start_codon:yes stop_codon:yes gene_type:complete
MFIVTKLVRLFLKGFKDLVSRTCNPDRVFIFFEKNIVVMYATCSEFNDDFTSAALRRFSVEYSYYLTLQGTIETNPLARYWFNRFHTTQSMTYIVLHITDEFDPDKSSTDEWTYQCTAFTDLLKAQQFYELQEVTDWYLRPEFEWVGSILVQAMAHVGSSMFSKALCNDEYITQGSTLMSDTSHTTTLPTPPQSPKHAFFP